MARSNGFVNENGKDRIQDIVAKSGEASTKQTFNLRNLIGELSKNDDDINEETLSNNVGEMLKSDDIEECATFSSLKVQYSEFKKRHDAVIASQECSVCNYYININRMYGRPSIETWNDDIHMWPNQLPSENEVKGSGPADPINTKEILNNGENIGRWKNVQNVKS